MAPIERTAHPRFKRLLSARELQVFYTLTADEVARARGFAVSDEHLRSRVVREVFRWLGSCIVDGGGGGRARRVEGCFELPAISTLDRLTSTIQDEVNARLSPGSSSGVVVLQALLEPKGPRG